MRWSAGRADRMLVETPVGRDGPAPAVSRQPGDAASEKGYDTMTVLHPTTRPHPTEPAIRRAAMRAMLAPSIHNTQPWRFVVSPGALDVFADPLRKLAVIDPDERALVISCGAAVFGARMSLAADGLATTVVLLPDPRDAYHLARIEVSSEFGVPDAEAAALDRAADKRHTNRRAFTSQPVLTHVVDRLEAAAAIEHAVLSPVRDGVERAVVTALVTEAERELFADPAYRSELRDWAGRPGPHDDGIPSASIPEAAHTGGAVPVRDFDLRGTGRLPVAERGDGRDCALILTTELDDRRSWLQAGQALAHVLLQLTRDHLVASLVTEFTELHSTRSQVRSALNLIGFPHVLLHVGHAEVSPPTPRRPVPEMLTEVR